MPEEIALGAMSNCAGGKIEERGLERWGEDGTEALLESKELTPPAEDVELPPREPTDDARR